MILENERLKLELANALAQRAEGAVGCLPRQHLLPTCLWLLAAIKFDELADVRYGLSTDFRD